MYVPSILTALREATRSAHEQLERVVDLTSPTLTMRDYRALVTRFHGLVTPYEESLQSLPPPSELDLASRRKRPMLQRDLEVLGVDAATVACTEVPAMTSWSEGFGCLYVLEGSTLGGQVISRHLATHLGVTPETGGAYFAGYGAATGQRWREFITILGRVESSLTTDVVVSSAVRTFRTFHCWLGEKS